MGIASAPEQWRMKRRWVFWGENDWARRVIYIHRMEEGWRCWLANIGILVFGPAARRRAIAQPFSG